MLRLDSAHYPSGDRSACIHSGSARLGPCSAQLTRLRLRLTGVPGARGPETRESGTHEPRTRGRLPYAAIAQYAVWEETIQTLDSNRHSVTKIERNELYMIR